MGASRGRDGVVAHKRALVHREGLARDGERAGARREIRIQRRVQRDGARAGAVGGGGDFNPTVRVHRRPRADEIGENIHAGGSAGEGDVRGVRAQRVVAGPGHDHVRVKEARGERRGREVGNLARRDAVAEGDDGVAAARAGQRAELDFHQFVRAGGKT